MLLGFSLSTRLVIFIVVFLFYLITYHVSKLLNFLVTTLPKSMPKRSTIRWARSGCEVPENTLMFGILECIRFRQPACFSKLSRIKLLARIGLAERTGITQSTSTSFYYKNFFILCYKAATALPTALSVSPLRVCVYGKSASERERKAVRESLCM